MYLLDTDVLIDVQRGYTPSPQRFRRAVQINRLLGIQPEFRRSPESRTELERHLGSHTRSAVDDPVDHLDLAAKVIRQLSLCKTADATI